MKFRWYLIVFAMCTLWLPSGGEGNAVRFSGVERPEAAAGDIMHAAEDAAVDRNAVPVVGGGKAMNLMGGPSPAHARVSVKVWPEAEGEGAAGDSGVLAVEPVDPPSEKGRQEDTGTGKARKSGEPGKAAGKEGAPPVEEKAVEAEPPADLAAVVVKTDPGLIDWTAGILEVKGKGFPEKAKEGKAKVPTLALRTATRDASRRLLALVRSVRVGGSETVADAVAGDDRAMAKVEDLIRGARVAHREYLADGTVTVTLTLMLQGGFSQLVLPRDIRQIQPVRLIDADADAASPAETGAEAGYTGLVVDVRGLRVVPSLMPRIVDENGRELYGAPYISREFAVQNRVSGFVRQVGEGKVYDRAGARPLRVRGLRVAGEGGTDVVISNADAEKLMAEAGHLAFMRECRVMMVMD